MIATVRRWSSVSDFITLVHGWAPDPASGTGTAAHALFPLECSALPGRKESFTSLVTRVAEQASEGGRRSHSRSGAAAIEEICSELRGESGPTVEFAIESTSPSSPSSPSSAASSDVASTTGPCEFIYCMYR